MSKRILHILTTTVLVSTVSFTAFAGNRMLDKADDNGDGLIQLSEFTTISDQKFANMDANNNGLVTPEERKAFRTLMRETRAREKFYAADKNDDSVISEAEFMAAREDRKSRMKERHGMNEDGQYNKEDRQARKKMHKKKHKRKGQHKGQRPDIDTNGDGAVDLAEHQAATLARFKRMDKNGDSVLGADEQKRPHGRRGKHSQNQHGMRR